MHVGNLRTALYAYLTAKSQGGDFLLRIEDTDQERLVEGAVDVIYNTLKRVGLRHDEGPDIGGPYAPYVQSQRLDTYRPYAQQLVEEGKAYYCFCTKERLESLKTEDAFTGYDRHCRDLPQEEVKRLLDDAYRTCGAILTRDRAYLEKVAQYLLEHETMDGETFERIMNQPV